MPLTTEKMAGGRQQEEHRAEKTAARRWSNVTENCSENQTPGGLSIKPESATLDFKSQAFTIFSFVDNLVLKYGKDNLFTLNGSIRNEMYRHETMISSTHCAVCEPLHSVVTGPQETEWTVGKQSRIR